MITLTQAGSNTETCSNSNNKETGNIMQIYDTSPMRVREFLKENEIFEKGVRSAFWLSCEELKSVKEQNLKKQLQTLERYSPYYSKLFREHGIGSGDFKSLSDLRDFPVTTRDEYSGNPNSFLLRPEYPESFDIPYEITYTSGTTNRAPLAFYNCSYDMFNLLKAAKRTCEIAWITSEDVILNLFPYGILPHISYSRTIGMAASVGAKLLLSLYGEQLSGDSVLRNLDEVIALARKQEATVLCGTHPTIRSFLHRAELLDFRLPKLSKVLVMGEPVPARSRDSLREAALRIGAQGLFVNSAYTFTECQVAFVECCEFGGCHNPSPDLIHLEILDRVTLEPTEEGEPGLLAITHLDRRGTTLLRYIVGDLSAVKTDSCAHCGRVGERLIIKAGNSYAVRAEDAIIVNGEIVSPSNIRNQLAGIRGLNEFSIVTSEKPSQERLRLRFTAKIEDRERIECEISQRLSGFVTQKPDLEFVDDMDLYDPEYVLKAVRFKNR